MSQPAGRDATSQVPVSDAAKFPSRAVTAADLPAIEALHDDLFGPGALTRAAYRVREGQPKFTPHCRVMFSGGALIASIRFTAVRIGDTAGALMLGPLAVSKTFANQGHGRRLLVEGLESAKAAGVSAVLLVGDEPYYGRFGFKRVAVGQIEMPGPIDPMRLLLAELQAGAATTLRGRVRGLGTGT